MRKSNPKFKGEDTRNRASGSTDILAGADCAFAITRADADLLKVECVKSRTAKEPEPFLLRLVDGEDAQSAYLTTEGQYEVSQDSATEETRAVGLIEAFYRQAEDQTVKAGDLYTYLKSEGFKQRTAERAHRRFRETAKVEQVQAGMYRLPIRGDVALVAA